MPEHILELRDIVKTFGGTRALDHVTLTVRPGEVHAIVGENGAGKSTLMKVLCGAYKLDQGTIVLMASRSTSATPTTRCGWESRPSTRLHPHSRAEVAENMFLGRLPRTRSGLVDWDRLYRDAAAVLGRIDFGLECAAGPQPSAPPPARSPRSPARSRSTPRS